MEEILRWTTPSPSKRRTATVACELAGVRISPGQKVVVWEGSANRDPRRFDEPDAFLLQRAPNPHLAFGHGAHFCLGAHLARLEIRVALEEILRSIDSFTLAAPVQWTRSNRHTGIRHLPLRLHKATTTSAEPPACDVAGHVEPLRPLRSGKGLGFSRQCKPLAPSIATIDGCRLTTSGGALQPCSCTRQCV